MKHHLSTRQLAVPGVLLLLASAGDARAFTRSTFLNPFGETVHTAWPATAFPIPFVLNSAGTADIAGTAEFTALRAGFQHYDDLTTATVSFLDNGTSASAVVGNDGVNRMVFVDNDTDMEGTSIIALSLNTFDTVDGRIFDGDIKYNEDYLFDVSGSPPGGSIDLQAVATHETGHMLGLDHSFLTAATMYPFYAFDQRSLAQDDIAGISSIYPHPSFYSTTGRITGSVRTLITDRPLFGVNVVALSVPGQAEIATAVSGADGDFTLPGLPAGTYYVRAQPVNPANLGPIFQDAFIDFAPIYFDGVANSAQATPVTVATGAARTGIDFLLPDRLVLQRYDGNAEQNVFFSMPAGANDWFAVRIGENLLPMSFELESVAFVNGNSAVNGYRLLVTPDVAGAPDLANAFADIPNVNATAGQLKSVALGSVEVPLRRDLWLVVKYPQGQPASVGIDIDGTDVNPPLGLTNDSFGGNGTNWFPLELANAPVNLAMSLTVVPVTPPPSPVVSALTPATISRGQSGTFTLSGLNFSSGVAATLSGSGVSVNSVTWQSATTVQLSLTASSGAPTGVRDLTVTNPDGTNALARSVLTVLPAVSITEILAVQNTPVLQSGAAAVQVGVQLTNTLPVGGFAFRLLYNPARMTPVLTTAPQISVSSTARTSGFEVLGATLLSPGTLVCTGIADMFGGAQQAALGAGSGAVVKIAFTVPPEDTLQDFPLSLASANLSDASGATLILPTVQGGQLQVKLWILGDINQDSLPYTIADALLSVSGLLGSVTLTPNQLLASDVNDDGVQGHISDTVFLVNVLLGTQQPLGKLSGVPVPAPLWVRATPEGDGWVRIDADAADVIGGVVLSLELSDGASVEAAEVPGEGMSRLPMEWRQDGRRLTAVLAGMSGERMPAGRHLLVRFRISDGAARLTAAEASDGAGRIAPVQLGGLAAPRRVFLAEPVPNPFNPATTIAFELPAAGPTRLALLDTRGREVAVLQDGDLPAGNHRQVWRGTDDSGRPVASGVYYAVLQAQGVRQVRKLALVR